MNGIPKYAALLFLLLLMPAARGQQSISPHLAYVYPAGGRQGSTFQVTVGGQYLGAVSNAFFSDNGIRAVVVDYNRPMQQNEFNDLRQQLMALQQKFRNSRYDNTGTNAWTAADGQKIVEIISRIFKNPPNRKVNPAMAETVTLKVTISADAGPGEHEIRLRAPNALSNPLIFCVGQLPEFSKAPAKEPLEPRLVNIVSKLGPRITAQLGPDINLSTQQLAQTEMRISLPATVNGQIIPAGVDRYRFWAHKGQQLVIVVSARTLIPYLADAVPGWFEAALTLYDAKGRELAYDERYHFRPDPVVHFEVPQDGEYVIAINDSIYRGRNDFVYRISIGELPFVTDIFPLGGPAGKKTTVKLDGWNLPTHTLTMDNTDREPGIYPISIDEDGKVSNPVSYAVDSLPECLERKPNNTLDTAQPVTLPIIINGRINSPGDEGVFRIDGRAGEQIVAEVVAHRLGSPLDSVLKLTDANGKRIAINEGHDDKGAGLETYHADSYLTATLPEQGTYYVKITDLEQNGGPAYSYRLRISEPEPDFALRVGPSSINVRNGLSAPVTVYALRRDGFTNAIQLRLKGAPQGFSLAGAVIPAGQDKARITLKALTQTVNKPLSFGFEGSAEIDGREVVHDAVPVDEMMQAFAYWHLVPAQQLEADVLGNPRPLATSAIKILSSTPIKITPGGTASIHIGTPFDGFLTRFELELDGAPDGITIQSVSQAVGGADIVLQCDATRVKPGVHGNLIVNILPKSQVASQKTKKQGKQIRVPAGSLPAIPFEIAAG